MLHMGFSGLWCDAYGMAAEQRDGTLAGWYFVTRARRASKGSALEASYAS